MVPNALKKSKAVEVRLLASFTLLLMLMIAACLCAFYVFASVTRNFDEGVAPSMEAVAESVKLAEHSHTLAGYAPHLILARNQSDLLNETLAFLDTWTAFQQALADTELAEYHQPFLAEMNTNGAEIERLLRQLDLLVAQRIEAETTTRRLIPNFLRMVEQTHDSLVHRDPQRAAALGRWRDHMRQVAGLLLSINVEPNPELFSQREKTVRGLLAEAAVAYPGGDGPMIADHARLSAMIIGPTGYFTQVRRIAALKGATKLVLKQERDAALALDDATDRLIQDAKNRVYQVRGNTTAFLGRVRWLIGGTLLLAVLATLLVVVYVERQVVRRMALLRENMTHYLSDNVPLQELGGSDEFSEMNSVLKDLVTRVAQREAEFALKDTTDSLTGMHNRQGLEQRAAEELARVRRHQRPLTLLLVDVDCFKDINNTYSLPVGDAILVELSSRCQSQLRKIDFLARVAGEEFAILLSETGLTQAEIVAERVRKAVGGRPFYVAKQPVPVTISIGVAAFGPRDDLDTVLQKAQVAVARAKQNGRNCVVSADTVATAG